jgi:hypothetical protein
MKWKFDLNNKNHWSLFAFLLLGAIAYFSSSEAKTEKIEAQSIPQESIDTFIPQGYTLVPVKVANYEAVSGLISSIGGVVDLYLAQTETQKGGLKVGSKLKIYRSQDTPDLYSVLIPSDQSSDILKYEGPFIAVIHNPKSRGAEITRHNKSGIQIHYQN